MPWYRIRDPEARRALPLLTLGSAALVGAFCLSQFWLFLPGVIAILAGLLWGSTWYDRWLLMFFALDAVFGLIVGGVVGIAAGVCLRIYWLLLLAIPSLLGGLFLWFIVQVETPE